MSAPTFGELFAGIAGFGVGLERAGLRPRWQVEIDPAAVRVLTRHWPDVPRYGDVTAVSGADLAPVDVLTAGFPCQDVSVAGKRAGLAGTRTGLFWQITRIVREMREATDGQCPTFLVLENVPGLLSSNGGRDMAVVLGAMGELGPLDCAWRILDAQYFGVAQRRRRLFVVADFRGERAAQVLFEPESGDGHPAPRRQAGQRIASLLASGAGTSRPAGVASEPDFLVCQTVTPTLSSNGDAHSGLRDDGGLVVAHALSAHGPRLDPNGEDFFVLPFDTTQVTSDKNYSTPRAGDTDHPLAAGMHAPAIASGPMVRRLTPRECTLLQGFPADWLEITDANAEEAHARTVLHGLWRALGTEAREGWRHGVATALLTPEVLLAGVHGGWISWALASECAARARQVQGANAWPEGFLRELWLTAERGPSPYRRESFEQLARELDRPLPELPLEGAQARTAMRRASVWPQASAQWPLRSSLTAGETWTGPGLSDSTRYRLLGNAVCCAVSTWLGHRLMEAHRG